MQESCMYLTLVRYQNIIVMICDFVSLCQLMFQMLNLNCNDIKETGVNHVVDILEKKTETEILL